MCQYVQTNLRLEFLVKIKRRCLTNVLLELIEHQKISDVCLTNVCPRTSFLKYRACKIIEKKNEILDAIFLKIHGFD